MSSPAKETTPAPPGPDEIIQLSRGYMASKFLFEASELHVFEKIGGGALTLSELAREIGIPARTARILVDGVAALGLLEKVEGGRYRNSPSALTYLSGQTPANLNPLLRFWNRVEYTDFSKFGDSLRDPDSISAWNVPPELQGLFSAAVETLTGPVAQALPRIYDFSQHTRIIDLGGGTGSLLVPICMQYPTLECTLFELPNTAKVARERLSKRSTPELPLESRIKVVDGNLLTDRIPGGFDAYIVSNVVHVFSPDHVKKLLENIRKGVEKGARLLLIDFWMDDDHLRPLAGALMAGAFLMRSGQGDVYSVAEVHDWLEATGWMFQEHVPLVGPQSLIVATA